HFKKFNDTHGHAVGDEVLKMVARGLEESTRKVDFCARYGGEEFVVIIPEASSEILERVAERQRQRIEQECLVHEGESLSVQISVGGACSADICGLPEAEALLREADACLYEAKRAGRNRSVCRSVERVVVTR
ncbi:MAG: GGDEF domain-containing protein, partial [Planctomycetes bacterium]|nr:GGDEF domain-containing protein [Planctomycetota bacterium]